MAEISLSEYTGYIYLEMIKAREMADLYSKSVAARYETDPVLKHFPTPRFKIPKLSLTIPMLVASARFSEVERFNMRLEEFETLVLNRLDDALKGISDPLPDRPRASTKDSKKKIAAGRKRPGSDSGTAGIRSSVDLVQLVKGFHAELTGTGTRAPLIKDFWGRIFQTALTDNDLAEAYRRKHPANRPFEDTLLEMSRVIKERTTIDGVKIQNLLINPETNVVRNGANEMSVFVVQAEMSEEGFLLKTVRDAEGGGESKIVEFD